MRHSEIFLFSRLSESHLLLILLIGGAYMLLLTNTARNTDDIDIFWLEEEGGTMIPTMKTVQTIARAYQQICNGEEPWIALGNFRNAWYGYAKHDRLALVSDRITESELNTEHTRRWGAFCAASVEFLCHCYNVPCPEWVHHPRYILTTPWWPEHAYNLSTRIELMQITPTPFLQRHIFCGNRLYQNKYEMSAWAQEARAKGITNPGEIFRYARQKEISIHGG